MKERKTNAPHELKDKKKNKKRKLSAWNEKKIALRIMNFKRKAHQEVKVKKSASHDMKERVCSRLM